MCMTALTFFLGFTGGAWGVLGDERAHIKNRVALIGTITLSIVASVAAMLVQIAISRSREYLADEGGAKLVGEPRYPANVLYWPHHGVDRLFKATDPSTAHMLVVKPFGRSCSCGTP